MRNVVAGVFAVLLLLGAAGGAWYLLSSRETHDPVAESTAAIEAYAEAWSAWDLAAMGAAVREPPDDFGALHRQFVDVLEPETTTVEHGPVTVRGSQADTDLTVTVELPRAGTWSWDTHLTLQRTAGEWSVLWEPETLHPELRPEDTLELVVEEPTRAPILAHDGRALSSPGTVYEIGIEPQRLDPEEVMALFREVLPEGVAPLERLLSRDDLVPEWYYPVVTVRQERFDTVWPRLRAEPGVLRKTAEGRVGTDDGFGLHLLGRLTELSEDEAAERGPTREAGDEVGAYGLEAAYDDQLTGSPEAHVILREPDGDIDEVLHTFQADPPEPLRTTLDADVQQAIENALVGVGAPAAIVAIDPATGGIRGSASRPLGGYNRGWEGRYPPGSTFKIVTAAAALAAGVAPDDVLDCPAETIVGGLRIRNAGGFDLGEVTLEEAFVHSCNTTFARLAGNLSAGDLARAAAAFGFDADYELPLDAFTASFPEPVDLAERAAAAIGQARVEASVLHMATVAAAVAGGSWHAPTILADAPPADGRALDRGTALALRLMMERTVAEGTGQPAAVPGLSVAGKTGSAEFGTGEPKESHAWFVGFASGGRGAAQDLAFAVFVEGGGSGQARAAPLAGRFLRELDALAARRASEQTGG